ncbi:MAG TPA: hypothetical protein VMR06_06645 [Dokdonella sp.]|uniref:hypothetical protein n=1 Tax=Dokdonella sp. TaxID=2291710 RepID=UPI002BDD38C0|nr:hypothetical protein [Dokdonella sp.]HUD41664.1 hypothetical protein [Dokdonella sp.]
MAFVTKQWLKYFPHRRRDHTKIPASIIFSDNIFTTLPVQRGGIRVNISATNYGHQELILDQSEVKNLLSHVLLKQKPWEIWNSSTRLSQKEKYEIALAVAANLDEKMILMLMSSLANQLIASKEK